MFFDIAICLLCFPMVVPLTAILGDIFLSVITYRPKFKIKFWSVTYNMNI